MRRRPDVRKNDRDGDEEQLQDDRAQLQKDYEALKGQLNDITVDRDNLAGQIQGLLALKRRARQLDAALEVSRNEMKLLQEKDKGILEQNLKL